MTPNTPKIQELKTKLENIEALRDVTEFELYNERLKVFLQNISPITYFSKCEIIETRELGWVYDIEFDDIGQGVFKLYRANSRGERSEKWHGQRYCLHELIFK